MFFGSVLTLGIFSTVAHFSALVISADKGEVLLASVNTWLAASKRLNTISLLDILFGFLLRGFDLDRNW